MTDEYDRDQLVSDPIFQLAYLTARTAQLPQASKSRLTSLDYTIMREMETIRNVTRRSSLTWRVAHAVRIRATIQEVSFEERSTRYLVTFLADGSEDTETIRSDRTDGAGGDLVRDMWSQIVPGDKVVIFKCNDPGQDSSSSHGYRVAPYIRLLRHVGA